MQSGGSICILCHSVSVRRTAWCDCGAFWGQCARMSLHLHPLCITETWRLRVQNVLCGTKRYIHYFQSVYTTFGMIIFSAPRAGCSIFERKPSRSLKNSSMNLYFEPSNITHFLLLAQFRVVCGFHHPTIQALSSARSISCVVRWVVG